MTNEQVANLSAQVRLEMIAMRDCGMRVPKSAMRAAQDTATILEYANSSMSAGEIAELLIELM